MKRVIDPQDDIWKQLAKLSFEDKMALLSDPDRSDKRARKDRPTKEQK